MGAFNEHGRNVHFERYKLNEKYSKDEGIKIKNNCGRVREDVFYCFRIKQKTRHMIGPVRSLQSLKTYIVKIHSMLTMYLQYNSLKIIQNILINVNILMVKLNNNHTKTDYA